jgi:lipopolysaccharide export system permease protein
LKKIYQYVVKSYLGPFVLTFFIALFILLMQFLWKYIDDLVGKGLEGHIIAQLMFYASATFVPLALPLAILLSSLMTFGNLGEHYELVAMKASGISTWKIMRPLVYLSFGISILAFIFSNNVLPVANLKFQSLLYDVRQQKLAFNISEGVFYNGIENYIIRVGEKDRDGRTIYDVKIYDHTDRVGNVKVTTAKSGYMELSPDQRNVIFTLFDGYSYTDIVTTRNYRDNRPFDRTVFRQQRIKFDLSEFDLTRTQEELFKSHYSMLNTRQLTQFIDSLNLRYTERKERYTATFYKRFQHLSTIDTSYKPVPKSRFAKVSELEIDSLQTPASDSSILASADINYVAIADSSELPSTFAFYDFSSKYDTNLPALFDSNVLVKADSIESLLIHSIDLAAFDSTKKTEVVASALIATKKDDDKSFKSTFIEPYLKSDKFNIIELAINAARNNRDNINFNNKDFEYQSENIRKHEIVWHKKFTLSIACLILFFIGAPMGAIIRKGGLGLPVVISVFFFVIYHITSITGEKAAKVGDLDIFFGVWLSSIVLMPIGIFLTFKSATDAPLLDSESWKKFFNRLRPTKARLK